MDFFERIAENRILEAMDAGLFDNLQGRGQPLKLDDEAHVPPELRMAYKILKMADCLPPELEVRREIMRLQDLLAAMPEEGERLKTMRRLNFYVMKLSMIRKSSPLLEEHEIYSPRILERLERAGK
jgi:hypothetical protein